MKLQTSAYAVVVLVLVLAITACTTASIRSLDEGVAISEEEKERAVIDKARQLFDLGKFNEAMTAFADFEEDHPQSRYLQASQLGRAECLENLELFQEAAVLYRQVYLKTFAHQPEIAAQALYRTSFTFEALGDDLKMIAALLDAQKRAKHLPTEIAYAEIPARLASAYARQGREAEARRFLADAEKGLVKILEENRRNVDRRWLAKTYFQMGSVSTNQISVENFESFVQGQSFVQVYLLKALLQNDEIWSERALMKLNQTFRDLVTLMEAPGVTRETKNQMGGSLIDLLDLAELFRPLPSAKRTRFEQDFFGHAVVIRTQVEKSLYSNQETMSLTEESQRLNGLRRAGRIKPSSPPSLSLPPKIVPSEDPNL